MEHACLFYLFQDEQELRISKKLKNKLMVHHLLYPQTPNSLIAIGPKLYQKQVF